MKNIKSAKVQSMVSDFVAMRAREKEVAAQLKELRTSLLAALGDADTAQVGEWLLLRSDRTRVDLDKEGLKAALGEKLKEFENRSSYEILEVKKA
jgi:hypothetical protein